jgi:hypothetical protein
MSTFTTAAALANRFREVILNGHWVANTNYHEQLSQIPFEKVTVKLHGLNSIAALSQHVHYYINGVNNVLKGGDLNISDKYSFDFPLLENELQWSHFLDRFWKDAENFAGNAELLSDDQLNSVFTDIKYGTYLRNIECMIEHSYYHLGQVVLIRKMLEL